jgi:hypothetical protein
MHCATRGIGWDNGGVVYLLHHPELGAYKIGIAQEASTRTEDLATRGWFTFRTLRFDLVTNAYRVEQMVLASYRDASLCPFLTRAELPSGWTETIDAEAVSLPDLWAEIVAAAAGVAGLEGERSEPGDEPLGFVGVQIDGQVN